MIPNEELFRKMMRFAREARMKRFQPEGKEGPGCLPPMMREMMQKHMESAAKGEMAPMPPHFGKGPHGKGPHGPCGKHGRGMSRERLLALLGEHPAGMWQKDLAWEADINASSASELIGRLEADGYLTREADENDRRAVLLKLTEAGQQRAGEIRAEREGFLEALFAKLSEAEKQTLSDLLDKLLN